MESSVAGPATVDPHEVRQETMIAMLERESRSFTSSILALSLLAVAFGFYPYAAPFYMLLGLRILSFVVTRTTAVRLERAVRERQPSKGLERMMVVAMAGTGITLGLLLTPPPDGTPFAAVLMVRTVVLVAVTLIAVTLAAMRGPRDAMLACFFATICSMGWTHPGALDLGVGIVALLTVVGIRMYAYNAGHHIVAAAEVLVEKRALSQELAQALERAEYLSSRDPLTGLFNRRKLFEQRRTSAHSGLRQLLTIDLDRFKAINDTFGHSAGDRVLVAAADAIRGELARHVGADHLAYRLGGEEFVILLEATDCDAARDFAEDLRLRIAAIAATERGLENAEITASIGIARWHPGEEFDDVLQRSDAACYEAKHSGRNTVRAAA